MASVAGNWIQIVSSGDALIGEIRGHNHAGISGRAWAALRVQAALRRQYRVRNTRSIHHLIWKTTSCAVNGDFGIPEDVSLWCVKSGAWC